MRHYTIPVRQMRDHCHQSYVQTPHYLRNHRLTAAWKHEGSGYEQRFITVKKRQISLIKKYDHLGEVSLDS